MQQNILFVLTLTLSNETDNFTHKNQICFSLLFVFLVSCNFFNFATYIDEVNLKTENKLQLLLLAQWKNLKKKNTSPREVGKDVKNACKPVLLSKEVLNVALLRDDARLSGCK